MNKSNLRIRTQIIIIFFAILITVSGILGLAFPLSFDYIKRNYDTLFTEIMIKETDGQLRNQMVLYDTRLKTIINQIFQKQKILNHLYIFVDSMDERLQVPDPIFCPDYVSTQRSLTMCCILIYGYNNESYLELKPMLKKEFKLSSFFNQALFIFDPSQFIASGIAFAFNTSYSSLSTWPALNFSKTFNPHQRLWYLNHFKQMSNGHLFQYSNMFTTAIGSYTIAISSNITDKTGQFQGIVLDLLDFKNFKYHVGDQYILVNQNGQIILGRFQAPPNTTFFLNDTNTTGYSQDDWVSIQIQANSSNYTEQLSTCSQKFSSHFICLYNSKFQYEGLIMAKKLQNPPYPPYLMIIFKDITEVQIQMQDVHSQIYNVFFKEIMISLQGFIVAGLTSILIFIIILTIIIKPIEQLIIYSKNVLKNKSSQEYKSIICSKLFNLNNKLIQQKKLSNNAIEQIIGSYVSILRNLKDNQLQNKKSDLCKELENIEYPKRKRRLKNLKLDRLPNNYHLMTINFSYFFN